MELPEHNIFDLLLIQNNNDQWVHPDIEEILPMVSEDLDNCDCYTGAIVRGRFKTKDNLINVIAAMTSEPYLRLINSIKIDEDFELDWDPEQIRDEMLILLCEDVYVPGGRKIGNEQFCFTDFGKKIPNLFVEGHEWMISPDVCIHTKPYGFST